MIDYNLIIEYLEERTSVRLITINTCREIQGGFSIGYEGEQGGFVTFSNTDVSIIEIINFLYNKINAIKNN